MFHDESQHQPGGPEQQGEKHLAPFVSFDGIHLHNRDIPIQQGVLLEVGIGSTNPSFVVSGDSFYSLPSFLEPNLSLQIDVAASQDGGIDIVVEGGHRARDLVLMAQIDVA